MKTLCVCYSCFSKSEQMITPVSLKLLVPKNSYGFSGGVLGWQGGDVGWTIGLLKIYENSPKADPSANWTKAEPLSPFTVPTWLSSYFYFHTVFLASINHPRTTCTRHFFHGSNYGIPIWNKRYRLLELSWSMQKANPSRVWWVIFWMKYCIQSVSWIRASCVNYIYIHS
jgi:hypothetical protein